MRRIEHTLEAIRPQLQADRGDIELVEVDFDKKIAVNLSGARSGCQMAAATLGGVQQRVMEDLGEFIRVLPATEMGKFKNPSPPSLSLKGRGEQGICYE